MAMRTFTHLYDSYDAARRTVEALEAAGIAHSDISIVSSDADGRDRVAGPGAGEAATSSDATGTGATTGTLVGGGVGLLTGLGLLAIPGVGPVVAAGWLVATLTGAGVGAGLGAGVGAAGGGLLGSLVHAAVPEEQAHTYAEGVRRGGTLVTVRGDDSQVTTIATVLDGRIAHAVDLADRRSDYQTAGWTRYDDTALPYTVEQVTADRARRVRILKTK